MKRKNHHATEESVIEVVASGSWNLERCAAHTLRLVCKHEDAADREVSVYNFFCRDPLECRIELLACVGCAAQMWNVGLLRL